MMPLLPLLAFVWLLRRSSSSSSSSVSGEYELAPLPTLQVWLQRRGNTGARAIAGFTWPNGHYQEIGATAGVARGEIGRTSEDKLSPADARRRMRHWWKYPYPEHRKESLGWRDDPNASDAIVEKWWGKIGPGGRKRCKVDWAAIQDNAPKGLDEKQQRAWWSSIGKDRRGKLRDPYEHSFGEDLGSIAKTIAEPLATYVLPQALNLVVPGSGVAVTAAIVAAKQLAAGKPNPKALVAAAMSAAGGPETAAVAAAVRAVKPAVAAKVAAAGREKRQRAAEVVAKAKMVSTAESVLRSPTAQRALARAGVAPASIKRASAMLGAMKNHAAALAAEKSGDRTRAAAHARASKALADAAKIPPETVQAGGRKLLYLALTPGDA